MKTIPTLSMLALAMVIVTSITGCGSKVNNAAENAADNLKNMNDEARVEVVKKVPIGDAETSKFANSIGTVKKSKIDPYTHSQDKANYVGKEPIAKNQVPIEKVMH